MNTVQHVIHGQQINAKDDLHKAYYLGGWGYTLVCFLAHRGPAGGLLLLQGFRGVADTQGIPGCLNALSLSSPHFWFFTVFSWIFRVARDDTFTS